MILALAGGVGGAKLANGFAQTLGSDDLVVVVNTGDDFEHLGMHISPDLDTVMYTLAGINNRELGWGIAGETWKFMVALEDLGGETWFRLGDRDMATHVQRTLALKRGESLSAVTLQLCKSLGIRHSVVPMSDQPVRTVVHTTDGSMAFQEYFVHRRAQPVVRRLEFVGAVEAKPSAEFLAALNHRKLSAIVICPSNPYLSIAPILEVSGVRKFLSARRVPLIAVSPIVGGKALKGPAAKIMAELGKEPSAVEVARWYGNLIDALVIDSSDVELATKIAALGIRPIVCDTVMRNAGDQAALAGRILAAIEQHQQLRTKVLA